MGFLNNLFNIFLWCIILACIIQCCCRYKRRQDDLLSGGGTTTTTTTTVYPPGTAPPTTTTEQTEQEAANASMLRSNVIKAMFPEQKIESNSTMVYDPESNSYQWTNDTSGDACCSICIENFEPGDIVISSSCSHCYHRDCIMGWLEIKDECPNCRNAMWDKETYAMMEDEVRIMEHRAKEQSSSLQQAEVVEIST